jgi:hypothetical protein
VIVAAVPSDIRSTLPSLLLLKDLADMEGEEKVRQQQNDTPTTLKEMKHG